MNKKDIFKKFLEENEVLIVDKNPGSRNRLLKTIYDLGCKRHMIHTCGSLFEAQEIVNTKKIGIVLSDYLIGGGSGFDLFKIIRDKNPSDRELCLILVTNNISQSAVAKAAEEDVDSFIIKPYTIQSIQESLISTVCQKIRPSEYIQKIEEAKELMKAAAYKEAMDVLKVATTLHPKPALALFYIGQVEYLEKHLELASESYNEGLILNSIHYKCLVGLFDILIHLEKNNEAYSVVKKIAKYFPANPDRLVQIVRLAVKTANFQDMQMYYDIFKNLDERQSTVINYIGAGMFVAGKYHLANNIPDVALKYFDNIAVSCSEFPKFIRGIVTALVEFDRPEEAQKFMSRFPAGAKETPDYMISEFLLASRDKDNHHTLVKMGLDLYNRQVRDYKCLQILIQSMEQASLKEDKIAPLREELSRLVG